jgi:hypothetical protein
MHLALVVWFRRLFGQFFRSLNGYVDNDGFVKTLLAEDTFMPSQRKNLLSGRKLKHTSTNVSLFTLSLWLIE